MGTYLSTPPKTDYNIPGRIVIVTGANRGIGFQTAKKLYGMGATVYLGCRSEDNAIKAIERIRTDVAGSGGQLKWLRVDMSSIKKARESAEEFLKIENQLDILIHNAATQVLAFLKTRHTTHLFRIIYRGDRYFEVNGDGVEVMMATNHFGPFVFTKTVLDSMKKTSAKPGSDVRIVSVSSGAHDLIGSTPVTFSDPSELSSPFPPTNYDSWMSKLARLGRSKLANVLFISELQRRLDEENSGIICISLNPGAVTTDGSLAAVSNMPIVGPVAGVIAKFVFAHPAEGALTSIFAATNPVVRAEPGKYKGKYLTPVGQVTMPSKLAQDVELSKRLWDLSERVVEAGNAA